MAPGGLEISQDLAFQRRQFRVQHAATVLFVLIVLAALLGLTGMGPLSDAQTSSGAGDLSVSHDRFLRLGTPTELEIRLAGVQQTTEVALDAAYLEGFDIDEISPQPDGQSAEPDRVVLTFEERGPSTLTITLTPREIGTQRTELSVTRSGTVYLRQFVYP